MKTVLDALIQGGLLVACTGCFGHSYILFRELFRKIRKSCQKQNGKIVNKNNIIHEVITIIVYFAAGILGLMLMLKLFPTP